MPVIASGNHWQPLLCCFLPMAQILWQTESKSGAKLKKILATFLNSKRWQTLAKGSTTKKQDKVEQTLHFLKVAKIGKMWYKQTAAKSSINFTLSFNGNYWHKKSVKN